MRKCHKCGQEKRLEEFKARKGKDGVHTWCTQCLRSYYHDYYLKHRERYLRNARRYAGKHREQVRKNRLAYYLKNRGEAWFVEIRRRAARAFNARNRNSARRCSHQAVALAIRCGLLVKKPCEVCGATEEIHAHHFRGYALENWFVVQWLCERHHHEAHGKRNWR